MNNVEKVTDLELEEIHALSKEIEYLFSRAEDLKKTRNAKADAWANNFVKTLEPSTKSALRKALSGWV
jgi:hypothetical protein